MTKPLALLLLTALMLPLSLNAERHHETGIHEKTVDIADGALRGVIAKHLNKPPDAAITNLDMRR